MPILYTIPSDGPSLTYHLHQQWLDKCQKNRLRTKKLQVGPYARPERNTESSLVVVHAPCFIQPPLVQSSSVSTLAHCVIFP